MGILRVLIVDDEPLARRRIRNLLANTEDVVVVGECSLGAQAVEALRSGGQDAVFLDIGMPDMDGFEVVRAAGVADLPRIVFVTAHGDRALEAFEVHAVDYLLKPFDDDRFAATIRRLRALTADPAGADGQAQRLERLLETAGPSHAPSTLAVRSGGKTTLLSPEEVLWVQADGNYAHLHTRDGSYLFRESMTQLEKTLVPHGFLRIHRSAIVRLAEVRTLGDREAALRNGAALRVSETYWPALRRALGV